MQGYNGNILELANARVAAVAIVDTNGDQLTSFPISGTVDVGNTVDVNITNPEVPVSFAKPSSAALTQINASASSVSLLAANVNRKKFHIYNSSGKTLYVAFGATASTTAFTVIVAAKTAYESELNDYTGDISGIWSGADPGKAVITELT